ncbi:MAG: alpha/beta fold hydrolase [Candidatus Dojkabacteria bacterium]|nr:alpha/beta fold hydrolase [Candidatus Dojkabacteria bacterium]
MNKLVFIKIRNNKGLGLSTIIHKPDGVGKYPTVILLHGFTGYKDEKHIKELAEDLADNGFVAVRFDASGFAESEGTIEKDFRFSNYVSDLECVHEYLKKQDYVDKKRIGLWGHSMGPMVGITYASCRSDIKAFCAVAPAVKLGTNDQLGQFRKEWKKKGFFEKISSNKNVGKIRIPYVFLKDAEKYDIRDFVKKVGCFILFIVGSKDKTTLPENSKLLYKLAPQTKDFVEIEGMGHDYKDDEKWIEKVNDISIMFFKRYL